MGIFNLGKKKEREFGSLFKKKYVKYTTPQQDAKYHVDLMVGKYFIDVKGMKKFESKDPDIDPTIHWVEIRI